MVAGDMKEASLYVAVLVGISLLVVMGMNRFTESGRNKPEETKREDRPGGKQRNEAGWSGRSRQEKTNHRDSSLKKGEENGDLCTDNEAIK